MYISNLASLAGEQFIGVSFQRKGTQKKAPIVSVLINCNSGPVFAWKLELLHPILVQPLDSIFNISVNFAFMNIYLV